MLPQGLEAGTAHIALYKLGAIAVPLFKLFGADAIEHRASNCSMRALITDASGLQKIDGIRAGLAHLHLCYVIDAPAHRNDVLDYHEQLQCHSDQFETLDTAAEDPALIIYTSGTTGHPKGALHAHRVLLGHLPGVRSSHDDFPSPVTGCGPRQTGHGLAGCSMCCYLPGITACRWWPTALTSLCLKTYLP